MPVMKSSGILSTFSTVMPAGTGGPSVGSAADAGAARLPTRVSAARTAITPRVRAWNMRCLRSSSMREG